MVDKSQQGDLKVSHAMVLAAGLGTRMRPLTLLKPKPLVEVGGSTLLDHAVDGLVTAGVSHVAINVHYLAQQIEDHVASRGDITVSISDERAELLDSGGGVKQAVEDFPDHPCFILNADSFWCDGKQQSLPAMAGMWDDQAMDMVLLLARHEDAVGFDGKGDFHMADGGQLTRRGDADSAEFVYAGAILARPALFASEPAKVFSLNKLFDAAIAEGRLFGCVLDGLWLHVGTPEAIGESEAAMTEFGSLPAPIA
ncbi:nucleotidyltransferase family protein [Ahrensia sp. R2A130]|uniref:nucleotidyltransferase family protein n=1 Tax=Ahrensia sp. R2A130 TaxID=744979 RepID=UPI000590876F|nr:nucleotidyltransferase family protein [Ahrensia sp. R2A130]